jgi:hypothetical protein
LKEIKLIGRQYTWENYLPDPTYEKLNRVLVTLDWDRSYPLAVVAGMNGDISDHVPLLTTRNVLTIDAQNSSLDRHNGWSMTIL